jgi:glycosyltransferase involved in cell wall biosynthesis
MFSIHKNNSKLRIGIDVTDITVDLHKGGIYHYIINVFSHLRDIDTENQYILFFNYLLKVHSENCEEVMHLLEGRNMRAVRSRFPRRLRKRLRLPANLFIGNVDILHGPFDNVLPAIGCKRITTIHDIRYFDIYPRLQEVVPELSHYSVDAGGFDAWNTWMKGMRRRVRAAVTKADRIITISDYSRDALADILHVRREKIYRVYNGVSTLFTPIQDREKVVKTVGKYGIKRDYLMFIGHIDPFKNILRMIDAYHILKNETGSGAPCLVIISPTRDSDWFYQIVLQKIKERSLTNDIHIVDNVPDEDIPCFYNGATALLIPSLYEGFGLPAIEAMACGTPVVASDICSLPEVAGDAVVFVNPYSVESISEGIYRILTDGGLRNTLSARGMERARHFSWEKTARETLEIYEQVSHS